MGMAASQARLLTLTARMHDIELKAQSIMSAKISLATQEDAAYQKYCDALDKTKIQIGVMGETGNTVYVDANYSNTCKYNENNVLQYALINNRSGKVMVTPDVKEMYENYPNDKYVFAWAMIGLEDSMEYGDEVGIDNADTECEDGDEDSLYMTEAEREVFDEYCDEDSRLQQLYDDVIESADDEDCTTGERRELLNKFRDYLYDEYGDEIFEKMVIDPDGFDEEDRMEGFEDKTWGDVRNEFNYYANLWEMIHDAGGCEVVDAESQKGDTGTEWFHNMITTGMVSIYVMDTQKQNGWSETSIATSVGNNYLQQVTDDKDIKKAEAEYEHELKIINRKEQKYDNELKNLETEETSLKTMIDSLKKVKDDNIERTFGIFS